MKLTVSLLREWINEIIDENEQGFSSKSAQKKALKNQVKTIGSQGDMRLKKIDVDDVTYYLKNREMAGEYKREKKAYGTQLYVVYGGKYNNTAVFYTPKTKKIDFFDIGEGELVSRPDENLKTFVMNSLNESSRRMR